MNKYINEIIELRNEHIRNLWVARRLVKATYLGMCWDYSSIMDKFRIDIKYLIKEKREFLRKIKEIDIKLNLISGGEL